MYSAIVLEHFADPHHMGTLADADVVGQDGIPGQGPFMVISLRMERDQDQAYIGDAWFETYGCPSAVACGSWLTRWARGKTPEAVRVIQPGDLSTILGGLPLGKEHCAQLAINALRSALRQLHEYR